MMSPNETLFAFSIIASLPIFMFIMITSGVKAIKFAPSAVVCAVLLVSDFVSANKDNNLKTFA